MKPQVILLELQDVPIYKQLQIEEAILRTDDRNWCIVNSGSTPAIVMGISGKREQLVTEEATLPVYKRFSGGGTVVVDESTCFVSTIFNHDAVPIDPFPQQVLHWNGELYKGLLGDKYQVIENDYALGTRKFGGNAQYFTKTKWLHHTTLLWDYDPEKMRLLRHPPKMPQYREDRQHHDFLCTLKPLFPDKRAFVKGIIESITQAFHISTECDWEEVLARPHRKATQKIPR